MNVRRPRSGRPRPVRPVRLTAVAVVAALALVAAACGSSSSSSTGTTGSAGSAGGGATTTNLASGCPFSGQTTPSSGPAKTEVATSLTKVSTRKADCIDNVQFDFSPGVPGWSVGYQTGPFTGKGGQPVTPPGSIFLVVEFQGVAASFAAQTAIDPSSLNYIKGVTEASGANGVDEWVISLDQKLPYDTTTSSTPAYFVLALG